jgi:hypothetical protein
MKTLIVLCVTAVLTVLTCRGQLVTNVAVATSANNTNYPVNPSQVITYTGGNGSTVTAYLPAGNFRLTVGQSYTGLTNITVTVNSGVAYASFQITTPAAPTSLVVSNYLPADCLVIPSSATGNVNIILETSPDLLNWTAAMPGTYGMNTGTNRFFRVRAQTQ